jgi:Ran-binding protein 3
LVKNGAETSDETTEGDGEKSDNKSTEKSAEKEKTLSESAAEYCENRNKKVEFGEVELITGEEEETNAFQMSAKLYMFDKDTSTWVERGRGQLRLNDLRTQAESGTSVTSRIIMRTAGSLRVILNSKIFPEMTLEKPTEKNIRLTAMDGLDQGMKVFLVSGSTKDVGTLFSALKRRLDTVKKSSTNTSQSTPNKETSKRKLSEEQKDTEVKSNEEGNDEQKPPPEKEAKLVQ